MATCRRDRSPKLGTSTLLCGTACPSMTSSERQTRNPPTASTHNKHRGLGFAFVTGLAPSWSVPTCSDGRRLLGSDAAEQYSLDCPFCRAPLDRIRLYSENDPSHGDVSRNLRCRERNMVSIRFSVQSISATASTAGAREPKYSAISSHTSSATGSSSGIPSWKLVSTSTSLSST